MLNLDFSSNISGLVSLMTDVQRKQVPFATSRALNATGIKARDQVRRDLPSHFDLRRKAWEEQGVLATSTNKRQVPMQVSVYDRHDYMEIQEDGGIRSPRSSHNIAVPLGIRGDKMQLVRYSDRPRQLLDHTPAGKQPAFKFVDGAGRTIIARRLGKKRTPLQYLYVLSPTTHLHPRFEFVKTVSDVALQTFSPEFQKEFDAAMASAYEAQGRTKSTLNLQSSRRK